MLHEILVALSGHPSPLFPASDSGKVHKKDQLVNDEFPLLSPSEAALLEAAGKLALLHRQIRASAQRITLQHPSTICRAVASSLLHVHLARFQQKILSVENRIVSNNADIVGAYNIVPLSAVAGEFDDWSRRIDWYWRLVSFIQDSGRSSSRGSTTGAALIDYLRAECQTGFPDVEAAAAELGQVAEKAWLKQLSVWLLYGNLPTHGKSDFFVEVHKSGDEDGLDAYLAKQDLLPGFVTRPVMKSLLFMGKSLHQIKQHRGTSAQTIAQSTEDSTLIAAHLNMLASLSLPLIPSAFSSAISSMRLSLSQKVLQRLLPVEEVKLAVTTLRQFFLLGRSDFAIALISEAQHRVDSRQSDIGRFFQDASSSSLRGIAIKGGEVSESLNRTWKALSSVYADDHEDMILDFAKQHIRLELDRTSGSRPSTADSMIEDVPRLSTVAFNDMLFPVKTTLRLEVTSPLDLFLSRSDISTYGAINAYLIALRRTHTRLSDLWRLTSSRREDPKAVSTARRRTHSRQVSMRKVWATCSAAVFLLSETTAYFEGEVIKMSWDHFFTWITRGATPPTSSSDPQDHGKTSGPNSTPHDPQSLAQAHRRLLAHLTHTLLLTDDIYTLTLRTLLTNIDHLVAHFSRLYTLYRTLDLEAAADASAAGGAFTLGTLAEDETREVALDLDRSRKRVDMGMKDVVGRLRELDSERLGDRAFAELDLDFGEKGNWQGEEGVGGYRPLRVGGVDRLLMKLDFGRVVDEDGLV